jgi:hypothetical protein
VAAGRAGTGVAATTGTGIGVAFTTTGSGVAGGGVAGMGLGVACAMGGAAGFREHAAVTTITAHIVIVAANVVPRPSIGRIIQSFLMKRAYFQTPQMTSPNARSERL